MKIEKIILLSFTILLLVHCKKESETPYPDDNILLDNAMATVYFHTVFREAEHAWAFIDSKKYISGDYPDPANTPQKYRKFTYNEETNSVSIEYNAWVSTSFPNLLLIGNIYVTFEKNVYRNNGAVANVRLNGFSINGQMVAGESKITSQKGEKSEYDYYSYVLLKGAAIHEKGNSMPVLISGESRDGRYIRTAGVATLAQEDDDVWTYSGTMEGRLGKDQSLTYTNSVLSSITYTDEDGEKQDGTVRFTADCNFAKKGIAQIKIPGRPDITYQYSCSGVDYVTVTHVK